MSLIVVTFVANCRDIFSPSPSRRPLLVFADKGKKFRKQMSPQTTCSYSFLPLASLGTPQAGVVKAWGAICRAPRNKRDGRIGAFWAKPPFAKPQCLSFLSLKISIFYEGKPQIYQGLSPPCRTPLKPWKNKGKQPNNQGKSLLKNYQGNPPKNQGKKGQGFGFPQKYCDANERRCAI